MKNERRTGDGYIRVVVIFGGTGDLSMGKVLPGLYGLHESGAWKDDTALILVGRKRMGNGEARGRFRESVLRDSPGKTFNEGILSHVYYCSLDIAKGDDWFELKSMVESLCGPDYDKLEMLFFLAIPPGLYESVAEALGRLGWNRESPGAKKLIVEKPFGYNLETACRLNEKLVEVFDEYQIYRIDHYLGKEMIQNIMAIRFSNRIFENLWNEEVIDNIQITVFETSGIKGRGGYYDKSGAIRDMVQSHILQLVALVAMDKPSCGSDEKIAGRRSEILSVLKPYDKAGVAEGCVIGQYRGDDDTRPYRLEDGVPHDSVTETFVAMRVFLDDAKWKDVPFYIRTGKRLGERKAYIVVEFKESCSYFSDYEDRGGKNLLAILIQPDEGVYLKFNIKQPGKDKIIIPVSMKFCQSCTFATHGSPKAYEGLIRDAMEGKRSRFTEWDEISAAWRFVDSIENNLDRDKQMLVYSPGSNGPEEADNLLKRDGRQWWEAEGMD